MSKIKWIVNTHSHVDHVAGNKSMQDATGAPIAIHEADADALTHPNMGMLAMFNAEPSPAPGLLLKDGDTISFGNQSVKVIHTPGHTPRRDLSIFSRIRDYRRHAFRRRCGANRSAGRFV